jgi:hypothetical protein
MTAALIALPKYLFGYVTNMLLLVASDYLALSLFLGCVVLGFLLSVPVAFAVFFLGHCALGTITNVALTLHQSNLGLARAHVQSAALVAEAVATSSHYPTT